MAYVSLTNITVLNNPTQFTNPFQFEVTFECMHLLEDDLEWKITYVGSAHDETHDQVLEEVLVGPVPVGTNKFVFQASPPNFDLIPPSDQIGVTIVLVTCSYREKEFIRVGYYVNNEYIPDPAVESSPEASSGAATDTTMVGGESEVPPLPLVIDRTKIRRNILADKPRFTRFPIEWGTLTEEKNNSLGSGSGNVNHSDQMMGQMTLGGQDENCHPHGGGIGMDEDEDGLMQRMAQTLEEEDDGQDYLVVNQDDDDGAEEDDEMDNSQDEEEDNDDDEEGDDDEMMSSDDDNEMDLDEIDLEDDEEEDL